MPEPTEAETTPPETDAATAQAEPEAERTEADAAPAEERSFVADEVLLASAALAQRALLEVTPPETVGSVVGHIVEGEHVLSLLFAADLAGYPGWHWSVTIARVEDAEPTVLETELMPGERALLAPEWVPWSDRLAEYRAAQAAAAEAAALAGDDAEAELDEEFDDEELDEDSDDEDDDEDSDDDGFDDHDDDHDDAFDGIEIDALDDEADDEEADDKSDGAASSAEDHDERD